jgi:hypothetical protein
MYTERLVMRPGAFSLHPLFFIWYNAGKKITLRNKLHMDLVTQQNNRSAQQTQRGRRFPLWLVGILVVASLFLAVTMLFGDKVMGNRAVTSDYQAVFLTNGQVYFGKLELNRGWAVMTDIYYLQLAQDLQPASSADPSQAPDSVQQQNNGQQQIQLVKLGSELHGPEDQMYIAKDKILFWENMKNDSRVLQSIKEYQSQNR